jgi:hypothetical protein
MSIESAKSLLQYLLARDHLKGPLLAFGEFDGIASRLQDACYLARSSICCATTPPRNQ